MTEGGTVFGKGVLDEQRNLTRAKFLKEYQYFGQREATNVPRKKKGMISN